MTEENQSENRVKSSKFVDQNQIPKARNAKGNGNLSKVKSSWGSQIVKGFSAEKKNKSQTTVPTKKVPLKSSDIVNQKNPFSISHPRTKRSLIDDLSCSVNGTQVHPHSLHIQKTKTSGPRDLFLELDHLRSLLQESKERECKLQIELTEYKRNPKVLDLQKELELKKKEINGLVLRVGFLESEKTSLSEQLMFLNSVVEKQDNLPKREEDETEMEILELRRMNKELQLEKRNLACRLSSLESQLETLAKATESELVEKIQAEASSLRHTNEDLCKQVEGLQVSRLNEVEELAYLRWVNSCLQNELRNSSLPTSDKPSTPRPFEKSNISISFFSCNNGDEQQSESTKKTQKMIKKMKKWPISEEELDTPECPNYSRSPKRRHSVSGSNGYAEDLILTKRRQSDGFVCSNEIENEGEPLDICKMTPCFDVEKRALRIPNPPPRPSFAVCNEEEEGSAKIPVPPPPPPPPPPAQFGGKNRGGTVQRVPQVVEFYHSLMKRDSRKDSLNGGICDASEVSNVRSSMIGEIENRSSHLLAIKADVETQGEFVRSLIREVNSAVYKDIEDVVAFVKWLDDELCFLVDERAVLKHFEWPEKKADTLREAAFSYRDLKKLECEVSNYVDAPQLPCEISLKKMVALSEKMERAVYNLLRTRDSLMRNCKEFQIPTEWMLDNGIFSKIKLGSVKLAKKYMRRVAMELQSKGTSEKDSSMDYMLLQGVRFAFRIHQFAGGFDAETMQAFEELRDLALFLNKK